MSRLIYHAREPLYSNVTVVAWWLQSQVHKIVYLAVNKDNIFVTDSEYDQEISQSQTADNPMAREEEPLIHHETPERHIKQSNQLSLPLQDDCNARMDIK